MQSNSLYCVLRCARKENLLPRIIHFPIYSLFVDRFQSYSRFKYFIICLLMGVMGVEAILKETSRIFLNWKVYTENNIKPIMS